MKIRIRSTYVWFSRENARDNICLELCVFSVQFYIVIESSMPQNIAKQKKRRQAAEPNRQNSHKYWMVCVCVWRIWWSRSRDDIFDTAMRTKIVPLFCRSLIQFEILLIGIESMGRTWYFSHSLSFESVSIRITFGCAVIGGWHVVRVDFLCVFGHYPVHGSRMVVYFYCVRRWSRCLCLCMWNGTCRMWFSIMADGALIIIY